MTTDNFCFYLQNRPIQTSQTGGQWYSDTFTFSIPWPRSTRQKGRAAMQKRPQLFTSREGKTTNGQTDLVELDI